MKKEEFVAPNMQAFFSTLGTAMLPGSLFGFLSAWWPLRGAPNVLLLHFSDMKHDHGSVRRIAEFLGYRPTPEQWARIFEYTSFPWMKRHEEKFEIRRVSEVPVLDPGAMVRKGKVGAAQEDGVTPAMSAELKTRGQGFLNDERALEWLYSGGALP